MNRLTFVSAFVLLAWLSISPDAFAQNDAKIKVRSELNSLYKELQSIDDKINSAADVDAFEVKYQTHAKLMESCYQDNSRIIRENRSDLYAIYENYHDLYAQIGLKIDDIKADEQKVLSQSKLKLSFRKYKSNLESLCIEAKSFVSQKNEDSLSVAKKKSEKIYRRAEMEYMSNIDSFDDNAELAGLWRQIDSSYNNIAELKVPPRRNIGDILFKLTVVAAIIFFVVNMINSKLKLKKSLGTAAPSVISGLKTNKNTPSI